MLGMVPRLVEPDLAVAKGAALRAHQFWPEHPSCPHSPLPAAAAAALTARARWCQ